MSSIETTKKTPWLRTRRFRQARVMPFRRPGRWLSALSAIAYIGLWIAISSDGLHLVGDFKFPAPSTVLHTAETLSFTTLGHAALVTWLRVLEGLLIGTAVGVSIGLAMAYSRTTFFLLDPIVEAWRPVPAIAFTPFLLLWFGLAATGKILLVVLGVAMILLVSTFEAARNVPRIYVNAARTLGASQRRAFITVVLPRIVPDLIGPLRVALAMAFTLAVAAEFMGSQSGLGFMLLNAQAQLDTGTLFLGVMSFGVIATLTDNVLRMAGRYITRWAERSEVTSQTERR